MSWPLLHTLKEMPVAPNSWSFRIYTLKKDIYSQNDISIKSGVMLNKAVQRGFFFDNLQKPTGKHLSVFNSITLDSV